MVPERPADSEYDPFYRGYVSLVPEHDVLSVLETQVRELALMTEAVSPETERYRYAPGKWCIREVIGHIIDAERAFGYRALCVSRGDPSPLPGFDENRYIEQSPYAGQPLKELAAEFATVRGGNLVMLRRLDDTRWALVGTANGSLVSTRALAFIMAGHVRHHLGLLRDRYRVTAMSGARRVDR